MDSEDFADRRYLKRRDNAKEQAWQFQFELDPLPESKFFPDKKFGSKLASYVAAKKYRDEFIASAIALDILGPDGTSIRSDIPVQLKLSDKNTSGIIGVFRQDITRKDRKTRDVGWIANYKNLKGQQKQKFFGVATLGEKAALLDAVRFRRDFVQCVAESMTVPAKRDLVLAHAQDLDFLVEYIESLEDEQEVYYFLSTINNPLIANTEKEGMLAIRIAQVRFRRLVMAMWKNRCVITGATQFLTAGHIKPWAYSNDCERIDPYNGLALSPVYDKAFDAGMISFKDDGVILVSPLLALNAARLGITGRETLPALALDHHKYLEYHRNIRFQSGAR